MAQPSMQLLSQTARGSVQQDCRRLHLLLEWQGRSSVLKFPCFVALQRQVNSLNVERMLSAEASDLEILSPCGCDRVFLLSVNEVLELQELLNSAKFSMQLNSLLHSQLYRRAQLAVG